MESGEIVLSASATHTELIASMMKSESLPSGTRTPLQYIRYDKYTANEHVTPHTFVAVPGYANDYHRLTVGLVTATKTRVLDTDQWITSTVYYDSKCRPMQEITDNLVGGVSRVTHSYDFVGNVVKSQEAHGTNTLEYAYTYDDRSRLLNVTASFNGATPVVMKTLEYDEVGRLKKVKLHNNTTSSEYDYNIRNWLTGITGSKFSQSLSYGNGNGNIRSMSWSTGGSSHSYSFTYDGANRLLDAIHGTGAYTEKVSSYDRNGNIMGLQRYGNGLIDDLTYSYNGNQLTQVEDATGNSAGFNNGASTANEYTYDYNGNLTKDSNKGISNIAWNSLNLPDVVTFEDGSTVTYTYAADGTKLRTLHTINGTTTTKDYFGSVIYENGAAKLWQTEAGYISMNDSKYHYYLQDHQGNNRVVVSETGATEEVNHYYAFGGLFSSDENVQPFKYNGKELDTQKGLNWYDYGARQYDAALGRWFAVDPLAEKYYGTSQYGYCLNNPINKSDPDGRRVRPTNPVRRGYRNAGRPNPYAFYPGGVQPLSHIRTNQITYNGKGLYEQVALNRQNYINDITVGDNTIQMTKNNLWGQFATGFGGLSNNAMDFSQRLLDMSTTTIYHEDGRISKSTNYIIRDPLLAEMQREYSEMYNYYDKQLGDEYSIFEKNGIIQEKIGISPLLQIIMNILTNPNNYEESIEIQIIPEFRQGY